MYQIKNKTYKLEEALLQTFQIWTWLSKHPKKGKEDWPRWEVIKDMPYLCPCCNYVELFTLDKGKKDCSLCPLFGFWPFNTQCASGNSLYAGWRNAKPLSKSDRIRRSKYAKGIAFEAFRRWMLVKGEGKFYSLIKLEVS